MMLQLGQNIFTKSKRIILYMIQRFHRAEFINMAPNQTLTKQSGKNHKSGQVTRHRAGPRMWDWLGSRPFILTPFTLIRLEVEMIGY